MYQHCCIFLHFITFLGQNRHRDFLNEILGHFPHFFHLVQMSHYWTFRAKLANTKSFVIFLSANIASRYYISLFSSMTGTIWLKINFKSYFSNSNKFWTLFWKAEVLFLEWIHLQVERCFPFLWEVGFHRLFKNDRNHLPIKMETTFPLEDEFILREQIYLQYVSLKLKCKTDLML